MSYKVSVIIPTHNRPELLMNAIDSVRKQTFVDWELIVVDDGDNPSAKPSLSKIMNETWFTYLETKKNQGGAAARNIGIRAAKGDYIAFLDDDDTWTSEKLSIQLGRLSSTTNDVGFSYTSVIKDVSTGEKTVTADGIIDVHIMSLTKFNGFLTITMMFKKHVLEEVGGFDETFPSHQDPELIIRVSEKYKALAINEPLSVIGVYDDHEHIGGNIKKRIVGREKLLNKHFVIYKKYPDKLAKSYFQLGLWYRELGEYDKSLVYLQKAFIEFRQTRYLLHIAYIWTKLRFSKLITKLLHSFE